MTWHQALVGLLMIGAAARITRVITTDTLTAPLRAWVARKAGTDDTGGPPTATAWRWLDKLLGCPWCSGFWVSVALVATHWPWGDTRVYPYVLAPFALSHVVGLARDWLDAPPPPRVITVTPGYFTLDHHQAPPAPTSDGR